MRKQVEAWQRCELTDITAMVVIYEAFVEGRLEAPKHWRVPHTTASSSHKRGVPIEDDLESSNAFTSAFKQLEPIPQFKVTAKLGEFLETRFVQ